MDGIHDLGGKPGFDKVDIEPDEPAFHERWEASVFAMTSLSRKTDAWSNADRFRHSVERVDPDAYLNHGYYGRWLGGIEAMLVEKGVVNRDEITARATSMGSDQSVIAARPQSPPDPILPNSNPLTSRRSALAAPLFRVGDVVTTDPAAKPGHTRLPSYARGKRGLVIASHDAWVYPDTNAHGQGEAPTHLYTVRFTAVELWGHGADPTVTISLDLFETYLS